MKTLLGFLLSCLLAFNCLSAPINFGGNPGLGVTVNNKVYIANIGTPTTNSVKVIDAHTYAIVADIPVDNYPVNLSIVGDKIVSLNFRADTISVINTLNDTKIGTIVLPYDSAPYYAFGFEHKLLSTNYHLNSVSFTNLDTLTVENTLPVSQTPLFPFVIGDKLFVVEFTGNTIDVFSARANTLLAKIYVAQAYSMFAASVLGDKIYIDSPYYGVVVIDTKLIDYSLSPTTLQTAPFVDLFPMDASFIRPFVAGHYVLSGNNHVDPENFSWIYITDVDTHAVTTVYLDSSSAAIAAIVGSKVYITAYTSNKIYILDLKNIALSLPVLVNTITGEGDPAAAIIVDNKLFIANPSSGTISVLNTDTDTFIDINSSPILNNFSKQ